MDLLRFGRIGCQRAGDPIVKAHPAGNQQVGFLDGVVDPRLAMHAHHAQVQFMGGGKAAQAKQGAGDGDLRPLRQRAHLAHRARLDDAVPGKDQRPLRGDGSAPTASAMLCSRNIEHGVSYASFSGAAAAKSNSAVACCASLVMSTSTGPGRPELATRKASRSTGAMSSARVTT